MAATTAAVRTERLRMRLRTMRSWYVEPEVVRSQS